MLKGWKHAIPFILAPLALGGHAVSQEKNDVPATLIANELINLENGDIEAIGDVRVLRDNKIYEAQKAYYNKQNKTLLAQYDIVMFDEDGNVMEATEVFSVEQGEAGYANDPVLYFKDSLARMAGAKARRVDTNNVYMDQAKFTPCLPCDELFGGALTWEIDASEVHWDREEKMVYYEDVFINLFGIPVFYTPYYSHPDPTVKRKTGFLTPTYGLSSQKGFSVIAPYYVVLSDNRDLTITPTVYARENPLLQLDYRSLETWGDLNVTTLMTATRDNNETTADTGDGGTEDYKPGDFRGYLAVDGKVADVAGGGLNANVRLVSDDTFLQFYDDSHNFPTTDKLDSTLGYENNIGGISYSALGIYTQDLRSDRPRELTGHVAPLVTASKNFALDAADIRALVWGSALHVQRSNGTDTTRFSTDIEASKSMTLPLGQLVSVTGTLSGDAYFVHEGYKKDLNETNYKNCRNSNDRGSSCYTQSDEIDRFFPTLTGTWKWPFIGTMGNVSNIITPVVEARLRPRNFQDADQPNEDSETSKSVYDTSITEQNRLRRDSPAKGYTWQYGIDYSLDVPDAGTLSGTFRQTRQPDKGNFVGSARMDLDLGLFAEHKFVIDHQEMEYSSFLIRTGINNSGVRLGASLDVKNYQESNETSEMVLSGGIDLTNNISFDANLRRDMTNYENREANYFMKIQNECLQLNLSAKREYTEDRDVKEETTFFVQLILKGLGDDVQL